MGGWHPEHPNPTFSTSWAPCQCPQPHLEPWSLPSLQRWSLPRGRRPSAGRSPKQGLEPELCLASLAMQGNSEFPRELLIPGQPCSPNIYISHYCLHMSLFSGGVSSFPLLPQCSPCSISSGAAISKAVACSHYGLINLQGKAKLSSGSNPSHRAWQRAAAEMLPASHRGQAQSPGLQERGRHAAPPLGTKNFNPTPLF